MKKLIYFLLTISSLSVFGQVPDTVRLGAGYTNQVWYSLENGKTGSVQSKDNWDIGFEISGYAASLIANTQKTNFALFKAPFKVLQWGLVDTTGISTWPKLYNSDTSWSIGAFNKTANPANQFDLGWGIYDLNTHYITGDSVYVVQLSATVYKKLKIDNLANGSYNFTYADINGDNEKEVTITKTDYKGKNFAYYDLLNGTAVDREPVSAVWDFTFVKYTAMLSSGGSIIPYPVTGILQNAGVKVVQADNITDVNTYTDTTGRIFKSAINEIGYDWKTYDFALAAYKIAPKQLFFVRDKAGKFWKVIFTGFASGNGQFSFTKEPLNAVITGVENENGITNAQFSVYPNPVAGENISLIFSSDQSLNNTQVTISDAQGAVMLNESVNVSGGIRIHELSTNHLKSGIYFVSVNAGGKNSIQKFVKQ